MVDKEDNTCGHVLEVHIAGLKLKRRNIEYPYPLLPCGHARARTHARAHTHTGYIHSNFVCT